MDGKLLVERLLKYAETFLSLNKNDSDYMRNVLLSRFGLYEAFEGEAEVSDIAKMDVPDAPGEEIREYASENGLADEDSAERFVADIFGILTPMP